MASRLVVGDMMEDFPVDTRPVPYERQGHWDYEHGAWKLKRDLETQSEAI